MRVRSMKRWIAWLAVLALALSGCASESSPEASVPPSAEEKPMDFTAVLSSLSLTSELVEIDRQGDFLRIEQIEPGLDTFDLTITTASLSEDRELGTVALGEGAWQTGWLANGFYAASLTDRTIRVFDTACRETASIPFPDGMRGIVNVLLDERGETVLLSDGFLGIYYLYDVQNRTMRDVHQLSGFHQPIGYVKGAFYLYNEDGLVCVDKNIRYATSPYSDARVRLAAHDRGIGVTDDGFCVVHANRDLTQYVTAFASDELPIAVVPHGFVTLASAADGEVLRWYDIDAKQCLQKMLSFSVAQVIALDDALLCAAKSEGHHRLYRLDATAFTSFPIEVTDSTPRGSSTDAVQEDGTVLIEVEPLSQWPDYPTGCESVSAVMAMRHAGAAIDVDTFVSDYLPQDAEFYYDDEDVLHGPNPYKTFVGYPDWDTSFGCMAPVIEQAMTAYFGEEDRVVNATGASMDELCACYLDKGIPVVVWATIGMEETYPSSSWMLPSGQLFYWPANEHCMLLVGYSDTAYYFNDPYTGDRERYPKSLFESRFADLGRQALAIPVK